MTSGQATLPEGAAQDSVKPDRRTIWVTTALGFSAGLPYTLLIGSVVAWMSNARVDYSTIGIISWVGLFYAFKFLWSPLLDSARLPFSDGVGRRRSWIIVCQLVIAGCLFGIAQTDPRTNLMGFAMFAMVAGFFSASQDVVLDAWRIEIASPAAPIDRLAAHYQAGYRFSSFIGQALALLVADLLATPGDKAAGWPPIFIWLSAVMALAVIGTLLAPEPVFQRPAADAVRQAAARDPANRRSRSLAAIVVAAGWLASGLALLWFFWQSVQLEPALKGNEFRDAATPWILAVTVGLPLAISYALARRPGLLDGDGSAGWADGLFEKVLAPLADLVKRYWLWALVVLLLAMSYRISDSVWGSFANPFYLNILQHSNSDIAIASKIFGVLMTVTGIVLGGMLLAWIGRMPTLLIGGLLAAITNLMYVDLAHGGAGTQAFLDATGLGAIVDWVLRAFVTPAIAAGSTVFDKVVLGDALTRLTAVIVAENLAVGVASVAYVAWLSSIVNKQYAAVQYALLSSLAFLVAVLPRPAIGKYVDAVKDQGLAPDALLAAQANRFADVFILSMWLGLGACVLVIIEWWRTRQGAMSQATEGPDGATSTDA